MFAFPFPTERNDKKFPKAIAHQINSMQAIAYSCIRICGFVPYLTSSWTPPIFCHEKVLHSAFILLSLLSLHIDFE